jgi:protein-tyrosine-phosphatase
LWREHLESDKQIPDPYGCNEETYRHCMDLLAEAVPHWVEWIKKQI